MSDSVRPHRWQPTRLPHPWDSPGKNIGVGCHFLLQCMKVKNESEVAHSCPPHSDCMDCSLPGSSVHGILQAKVLELGAIALFVYAISSVQFTHSVVSDSLCPHESQHARPPCPSQTPGVHSNSCPSSRWCHPAISSSVVSPSPLAPNPSQHHSLFQGVNSSHEVTKVCYSHLQFLEFTSRISFSIFNSTKYLNRIMFFFLNYVFRKEYIHKDQKYIHLYSFMNSINIIMTICKDCVR